MDSVLDTSSNLPVAGRCLEYKSKSVSLLGIGSGATKDVQWRAGGAAVVRLCRKSAWGVPIALSEDGDPSPWPHHKDCVSGGCWRVPGHCLGSSPDLLRCGGQVGLKSNRACFCPCLHQGSTEVILLCSRDRDRKSWFKQTALPLTF